MKPLYVALLAFLLAVLPFPANAQTTTYGPFPSFVLVTWNIQSGQSDPNVIAQQMALFDGVDIWLLQEVNKREVAILEAGAEDGEGADFTSVLSSAGDGNHLLTIYNDDRFDVQTIEETPEINILGRVRPMLTVLLYDDTSIFAVANNHLYSSNAEARVQQARLLNQWAKNLGDAPIIAGGDMNFEARSDDRGYAAITAGELWQRIAPDNDGPTRPNGRAIDHIFVVGTGKEWPVSAQIIERENDLDNEQNSDHRPVLALVGPEVVAPLIPCSTLAQECLLYDNSAVPTVPAPAPPSTQTGVVTAASANLRSGPGTTFTVVGSVRQDDALTIVGRNADGSWLQLDSGAWIAAFLVGVGGAAPTTTRAAALGITPAQPAAAPTVAPAPPSAPPPTATPEPVRVAPTPAPQAGNCDPSYPDYCIPSPPPDLDCGDIPYRHFRVVGADPHRFDGNHDGEGCES